MKQIYIVLTYSGTFLSTLIKLYTRKKYSHVSIALDENLDKMYSFGRLNPYNAFIAGFVREGIDFGTFKRFKNTDSMIYSLEVTDEQCTLLSKNIEQFLREKEKYKFNMIGLLLAGFNLKRRKENYYYCAEFVKHVLEKSGINMDLPEIIKPEHFANFKEKNVIYEGKLNKFGKSPLKNVKNLAKVV